MSDLDAEDEPRVAPDGREYRSPSRVNKYKNCKRAAVYRYNQRIRVPSTVKQHFGKRVHAQLESYGKTGQLPQTELIQIGKKSLDVGKIAMAGLPYLPLRASWIQYECNFDLLLWGDVWFQGTIDVYDTQRVKQQHVNEDGSIVSVAFEIGNFSDEYVDASHELRYSDTEATWAAYDKKGRPIPLVIDHKTTGNFMYMKSADDLNGDAQIAFYGRKALEDFKAKYGEYPEHVHMRWVYYLRDNKETRAKCTDLRVTAEEILESCERWKPYAYESLALEASKLTGENVPGNALACDDFGGCEYGPPKQWSPDNLNICRVSPVERLRASMSNLSAEVQQAMAAAGAGQPAVNPFANPNAPEANTGQRAVAMSAVAQASDNPFGAPPAATSAPAGANPFGAPVVSAPAAAVNPFAGVAIGGSAPPAIVAPAAVQPAVDVSPWAPPPAAAPPAVDPREAECPAHIPAEQRKAYLKWCDEKGVDHKTMQAKGTSPAVVPAGPAMTPAQEAEAFKSQARRMWAEGRRPDASHHQEVIRYFNAIEAMEGPSPNAPVPAPAAPVKRTRKKRDAAGVETDVDDDGSMQLVITKKAVQEAGAFLLSLAAKMPD